MFQCVQKERIVRWLRRQTREKKLQNEREVTKKTLTTKPNRMEIEIESKKRSERTCVFWLASYDYSSIVWLWFASHPWLITIMTHTEPSLPEWLTRDIARKPMERTQTRISTASNFVSTQNRWTSNCWYSTKIEQEKNAMSVCCFPKCIICII